MSHCFQRQMDYLLTYACSSTKYLVHRDMLGTSIHDPFMISLQNEIFSQAYTQKHFSAQHMDGWFGHKLHGINGIDCHIGGLLNLGVKASNPAIQKAITALLIPAISAPHKNWFCGGNRAIVANILAMTKTSEDIPVFA
ncbi:MAG: hypothetical protein J6M20_12055 [Clostridia bacterium]|nr:hypothetical protein [Clostridia bacterium]